VGWYDGLPEKCDRITWKIPYNKPVIISECGGGALQGFHGDTLTRWSEEYQEDLYKRTLGMLIKIPQLRGISPWILCDFRSPRRVLPGIQDGWNRKGVIGQNGRKKKAFFVLKNFYDQMEMKYK
jgi:beta-glucuronidase